MDGRVARDDGASLYESAEHLALRELATADETTWEPCVKITIGEKSISYTYEVQAAIVPDTGGLPGLRVRIAVATHAQVPQRSNGTIEKSFYLSTDLKVRL